MFSFLSSTFSFSPMPRLGPDMTVFVKGSIYLLFILMKTSFLFHPVPVYCYPFWV
jgi:hypothetical protein